VTGAEGSRQGSHYTWHATHRLTSPDRIAALRTFLVAHGEGWQENIFAFDGVRHTFSACGTTGQGSRFILGAETLGVDGGKNFSRPLCRRDLTTLTLLLAPEAPQARGPR